MRKVFLALLLTVSLPHPARGQSLSGKTVILCRSAQEASRTIALNHGRTEVSARSFRYASGCKLWLADYVRLAAFPQYEQIWHGIRFKVMWVAVRWTVDEKGRLKTHPYVPLFSIVWEEPAS